MTPDEDDFPPGQYIKSHETPSKQRYNNCSNLASARLRQLKKQRQLLRNKLS